MSRAKFFLDNASPEEIVNILLCVRDGHNLTKSQLEQKFIEKGYTFQGRFSDSINRLIDLEILYKDNNLYGLSNLGKTIKRILLKDMNLFYEIMHYMHYTMWLEPNAREYFWTYKVICDSLWTTDKSQSSMNLASLVMDKIHEKYEAETFAFSGKSISRTVCWVKKLVPCPLEKQGLNEVFVGREISDHKFTLLSVDYYYRSQGLTYGFPLLLAENVINDISKCSLVLPNVCEHSMNRLIEMGLLRRNIGPLGISVILDQKVSFEDFS